MPKRITEARCFVALVRRISTSRVPVEVSLLRPGISAKGTEASLKRLASHPIRQVLGGCRSQSNAASFRALQFLLSEPEMQVPSAGPDLTCYAKSGILVVE